TCPKAWSGRPDRLGARRFAALAATFFATAADAAAVRVLPAPRVLRFELPQGGASQVYAKGDVLIRAFLPRPETAHLRQAISVRLNGADARIEPYETLVKGLVTDVWGSWLFRPKGELRSATPTAYCTYREKSPIEQGVLFGKQNFERCLIDGDE